MLTEVIIAMSITEEHAKSSWNLPAINTMSAIYGKNLLTEVGMAHTNEVHNWAKSNSSAKIS
jgi:hypothetical protein